MKNKFKTFSIILLAFIFAFSSLLMVGCKNDNANPVSISDDGYWVINGEKTEIKATGEKGDPGRDGRPGNAGKGIASVEKTTDDETGVDTYTIIYTDGTRYVFDVANGVTPIIEIKEGKWWINGKNTGYDVAGQGDPGQDGHEVEFRTTETHIQWRYVDNEQDEDENWEDLVALADIKGADGQGTPGSDGREVEFQVADGYIQWRYKTDNDSEEWANLIALEDIKGADGSNGTQGNPGHDGREVEFRTNETYIQWRYVDANQGEDENWTNLVALEDIKGDDGSNGGQGTPGSDGREVEFQVANGYIQWRYKTADDSEEWINLIALSDITGQDGQDTSYELYTITFDYHGTEELFDFSSSDDEIVESIKVKSSEWLNGKLPELKENYNGFLLGWFIKGTNVRLGKYDFIGGNVTLEPIFDFNSLLNALKLFNSKHNTLQDVIDDIKEFGIDLVEYDAGFDTDLTRLVWDSVNDQIYLYIAEENDIDTLKAKQTEEVKEINCFTIYHADDYEIVEESENEYSIDLTNEITSVYLAYNEELNGVIVRTDKGLDVGENENIKEVDYYNVIIAENPEDYAQTVIIRMNGGTLDITAPYDTVNKYGIIDNLNINSVANNSYHEYGITGFAAIAEGRIVLTKDALIGAVHVVASEVFDSENGETEFRPVVLTAINNASIPTITRDEVTLEPGADNKVKVFEIQQIDTTGEEVKVNSAFVYIAKDEGSGEESAVVTVLKGNVEVELDLTDTTNPATVLAATIADTVEESKTAVEAEENSAIRMVNNAEDLLNAVEDEVEKIILMNNIEVEDGLTITRDGQTIDLNGYTLNSKITVNENAVFTLTGKGILTAPNTSYTISNQGTTIITENAKFEAPTITAIDAGGTASLIENGWSTNSEAVGKTAIMIIKAGRFEGGQNTIENHAGGELEINGGYFRPVQHAISTKKGADTTIYGGSFFGEIATTSTSMRLGEDKCIVGQIDSNDWNEVVDVPAGYTKVLVSLTSGIYCAFSTVEEAEAYATCAVIKDNETSYYMTYSDALTEAENGTVKLFSAQNVKLRNFKYAIDLNGYQVSLDTSSTYGSMDLTIFDSSDDNTGSVNFGNIELRTGKITFKSGNFKLAGADKAGTTLVVEGGTFDIDPTDYVDLKYNITKTTVDEVDYWTVTDKSTIEVSTYAELVAASNSGIEYIVLTDDIICDDQVNFANDAVINLNNHNIYNVVDIWNNSADCWSLISVQSANLTILGNGELIAKANDCYALDVRDNGTITINGGTYNGNVSAIYAYEGFVTINAGEFSIQQKSDLNDCRYLLNCYDASYKSGIANFTVNGGTFNGFDPSNNASEGQKTNYVTEMHYIEEDGDAYTVKEYAKIANVNDLISATQNGGYYMLTADVTYNGQASFGKDTMINLNGHKLESANSVALSASSGATLTLEGNGNVVALEACVMAFNGSNVIINGGTYTSRDNFVIGTNGNAGWGENTITINDGVFNGGIESAGYVACGIYVANSDTVTVNAGTFNIANGVGILARSGNTTVGDEVEFNVTGNGVLGKVGDSKVTVPSGEVLVLDLAANYPGGEPTLTNNSEYEVCAVVESKAEIDAVKSIASEIVLTKDITTDKNNSIVFSRDCTLNLNGHRIESTNDVALRAVNGATLTIVGEGNVVAQEACVMAFSGSTIVINGGTYTARDNFVIGTNGSAGQGNNTITINGGVFNGNIESAGYIACGIYAANNDTITVNAGTFNITNGTGIVVRAGNVTIGKEVLFNCTNPNELADGKVGDSRVAIPAGKDIAIELHSNYPGFVSSGLIVTNYNDCTVWTNTNGHTFTEEPTSDNQGTIYTGTYVAN